MNQKSVPFTPQKVIDILSLSQNATAIYSGEDIIIQAANDAIIRFWGKDRSVIGQPLEQAVPELSGQPFMDILREVWRSGITYKATDSRGEFLVDGENQVFYFDFEYRAIKDERGQMECILNTATDVTDRFHRKEAMEQIRQKTADLEREQALNEELAAANEELTVINEELFEAQTTVNLLNEELESRVKMRTQQLQESEAWFRNAIEQAPMAIVIFRGSNMTIDSINPPMLQMLGRRDGMVGKPLLEAIPELTGQPAYQLLHDVFTTGRSESRIDVPVLLDTAGKQEIRHFNFAYTPLIDEGKIVGVIDVAVEVSQQVAARKAVETMNDELSAINEEMAAANEELAATIEELAVSEHNYQLAEERLRLATESAGIGTWSMDTQTREIITSARFREILGFDPQEELSYQDTLARVDSSFQQPVMAAGETSRKTGNPFFFEYPIRRKNDDTVRWVRSIGKPNLNKTTNEVTFTGIMQDITEQKQDEQRKNDFIGMVSHELKTPLTSLYGYIQMLKIRSTNAEDAFTGVALEKAVSHVKKMTAMVNGFLNVSHFESGKIVLNKETFPIYDLLTEMIDEAEVIQLTHRIRLSGDATIRVEADRDKIGNVIANLLSNAIKYSDAGKGIDVMLQQSADSVIVCVKDHGIGIRHADLDKLFDRYFRARGERNVSGFGIGLYLSSEIIKRHSGRIWVESELGKGSTFFFSLPIHG